MRASRNPRPEYTKPQLAILEQIFHDNTHPSLEQRQLLAIDIDLELNDVTGWFQTKRKAQSKRKATVARDPASGRAHNTTTRKNSATTHRNVKSSHYTRSKSASSTSTSSVASGRPSLDRVASRSESCFLPPRTPSRRHKSSNSLWENMPSSPIAPPSSPFARDYVEFGRKHPTLEWACARSRLTARDDEDVIPELFADAGNDSDVEFQEAVTPPSSCDSSWTSDQPGVSLEEQKPDEETMKAAMALCDLMSL
ncbi:homeobox domain-containing protein [Favolaschia claudopus]|uniref:Homeobox domain-containing protein n=1 Tax=Favolaschia claudopus TaxID=2862362 RepID=A0AAW0EI26_9AGAR